ncbi:response regulator [Paenibacillus mesophilus]|uniref:response regulator n=1 Tax=Paenibacillus mesophilus TaxID=2582849 RepID=UPI00110E74D7|nr:response regulator [Paenibacillus mesophilus]TMV51969.1 response regulator [Paenibacillus mesophilus]
MNVLIVDDEPIIRIGLKSLVNWEEHGFRLVGEASDGVEALEHIRREPVDIVITDIRMPKMDGLELMREVKAVQRDVGLLVLSCLDDFAFVKEAMKLGAHDYILKPTMEPDELLAILRTIRTKLEEERQTKRVLAEWREQIQQSGAYRIAEWLRQYVQTGTGQERLEAELFQPGCGVFSIWIEGDPGILPAVDEWPIPHSRAIIKWSDKVWIALCSYEKGVSEKERYDRMFGYAQTVFVRMKETSGPEDDWVVCLGPVIPKLSDFSHALSYHRLQLHERFYGTPERFVVGEPETADDGPLPAAERNDFLRAVSNGNREAAFYWIDVLTGSLKHHKPNVGKLRTFLSEMLGLAFEFARQHNSAPPVEEEFLSVSLDNIRAIPHIDPLCLFVRETARQLWSKPLDDRMTREPSNPFIKKAVRFMREHYNRNIGTVDIADHVKLSRSYLSDLFSKEMGESLTETLTRIRIEEAKRKLRTGEMKVYEIAEAVGFSDPKSFAKTFKRFVGCTPKEFEAREGEGAGRR